MGDNPSAAEDGKTPKGAPRQKRAYCKRGTGATAKKKRSLAAALGTTGSGPAGGFSSTVTTKKYVTKRELAAASAAGRYLQTSSDLVGAGLVVNQAALLVAENPVACLNALLIASREAEIELTGTDLRLLDSLARLIDFDEELKEDDPMLPWKGSNEEGWPSIEEWRERAKRAREPERLAAVTVLRNLCQTPSNRSKIAGHTPSLAALSSLLAPPLLGSPCARIAVEAAAGVCRWVELGGLYVLKDHDVIVPLALRFRRISAGWTTTKVERKLRVARRLFRRLRAAVAYAANEVVCYDETRWIAVEEVDKISEEQRRLVGLRALEALASVRSTEANFYLLATAPDDLIERAVEKLATRDSETKIFALEFLNVVAEATARFLYSDPDKIVPQLPLPCALSDLAGNRVARHPHLIDLALATIVATHNKFNHRPHTPIHPNLLFAGDQQQQQQVVSPSDNVASVGGPVTASRFDAGTVGILPETRTVTGPAFPAPSPDVSLAPLRSHRADTVRLICSLLAHIAKLDPVAKQKLVDAKPLLHPPAASDELVADLVFNKLA